MEIILLQALTDNYIYLIANKDLAIVIDPSEAKPVLDYLAQHNLKLTHILNTHHHNDHTGGNLELKEKTGAIVIGSTYDQHRINGISIALKDNDHFQIDGLEFVVMFVPGHTSGHIAFYFPKLKSLFCGDTLFSLGCGRLFEGTAHQMYNSLDRIKSLPLDTLIYCGHEYTLNNAKFAITIEPGNHELIAKLEDVRLARKNNQPTIPAILEDELKTNPFLRTESIEIRRNLQMVKASDVEVFAEIRNRKNKF